MQGEGEGPSAPTLRVRYLTIATATVELPPANGTGVARPKRVHDVGDGIHQLTDWRGFNLAPVWRPLLPLCDLTPPCVWSAWSNSQETSVTGVGLSTTWFSPRFFCPPSTLTWTVVGGGAGCTITVQIPMQTHGGLKINGTMQFMPGTLGDAARGQGPFLWLRFTPVGTDPLALPTPAWLSYRHFRKLLLYTRLCLRGCDRLRGPGALVCWQCQARGLRLRPSRAGPDTSLFQCWQTDRLIWLHSLGPGGVREKRLGGPSPEEGPHTLTACLLRDCLMGWRHQALLVEVIRTSRPQGLIRAMVRPESPHYLGYLLWQTWRDASPDRRLSRHAHIAVSAPPVLQRWALLLLRALVQTGELVWAPKAPTLRSPETPVDVLSLAQLLHVTEVRLHTVRENLTVTHHCLSQAQTWACQVPILQLYIQQLEERLHASGRPWDWGTTGNDWWWELQRVLVERDHLALRVQQQERQLAEARENTRAQERRTQLLTQVLRQM
jgi:hypothetical protein